MERLNKYLDRLCRECLASIWFPGSQFCRSLVASVGSTEAFFQSGSLDYCGGRVFYQAYRIIEIYSMSSSGKKKGWNESRSKTDKTTFVDVQVTIHLDGFLIHGLGEASIAKCPFLTHPAFSHSSSMYYPLSVQVSPALPPNPIISNMKRGGETKIAPRQLGYMLCSASRIAKDTPFL